MEKSANFKRFKRFLDAGAKDGQICFTEQDGELWFVYRKKVDVPTKHHSSSWYDLEAEGKIPKEVVAKGKEAIKKYAESKIAKEIKKQKDEHRKWEEFERNPNFPISVEFDGRALKGRIISAEDTEIRVRLEKPVEYRGEDFIIFGFGSAMAGHKRFEGLGKFTEYAISRAKGLLIEIYKEKKQYFKNKTTIDLAKKLNEEEK